MNIFATIMSVKAFVQNTMAIQHQRQNHLPPHCDDDDGDGDGDDDLDDDDGESSHPHCGDNDGDDDLDDGDDDAGDGESSHPEYISHQPAARRAILPGSTSPPSPPAIRL